MIHDLGETLKQPRPAQCAAVSRSGGLLDAFSDGGEGARLLAVLAFLPLSDIASCRASAFGPFKPRDTDRWDGEATDVLALGVTYWEEELLHDEYSAFDESEWANQRKKYIDLFTTVAKLNLLRKLSGRGGAPATTIISVPPVHAYDEVDIREGADKVSLYWADAICEIADEVVKIAGPSLHEKFSLIEQAKLEILSIRGPAFKHSSAEETDAWSDGSMMQEEWDNPKRVRRTSLTRTTSLASIRHLCSHSSNFAPFPFCRAKARALYLRFICAADGSGRVLSCGRMLRSSGGSHDLARSRQVVSTRKIAAKMWSEERQRILRLPEVPPAAGTIQWHMWNVMNDIRQIREANAWAGCKHACLFSRRQQVTMWKRNVIRCFPPFPPFHC